MPKPEQQLSDLNKFLNRDLGTPYPAQFKCAFDEETLRRIIREETKRHPMEPLPGELDRLKAEFDKRKEYGL